MLPRLGFCGEDLLENLLGVYGVKVFVSSAWLEKNNEGWGSITILRGNSRKCL